MERLLKTPFCSELDPSVYWIQCALLEFSYGCVSIRTPWLPPFVLYVRANCMSADRTDRSEDGDSQAERAISLRREIAYDSTKSRLAYTAREVRVSVVPDFRLHPSSGFGSLPFCQLGRTKWLRTDPSKIPFLLTHISCKNRLPQYKVLCAAFFQESAFPLHEQSALPPFCNPHSKIASVSTSARKTAASLRVRWNREVFHFVSRPQPS